MYLSKCACMRARQLKGGGQKENPGQLTFRLLPAETFVVNDIATPLYRSPVRVCAAKSQDGRRRGLGLGSGWGSGLAGGWLRRLRLPLGDGGHCVIVSKFAVVFLGRKCLNGWLCVCGRWS